MADFGFGTSQCVNCNRTGFRSWMRRDTAGWHHYQCHFSHHTPLYPGRNRPETRFNSRPEMPVFKKIYGDG